MGCDFIGVEVGRAFGSFWSCRKPPFEGRNGWGAATFNQSQHLLTRAFVLELSGDVGSANRSNTPVFDLAVSPIYSMSIVCNVPFSGSILHVIYSFIPEE